MKKQLSLLTCLIIMSTTHANELSDDNLVKRSLTLKSGEAQLAAAIGYAKTADENDTFFAVDGAYGITDNWSVGLGHTRYRFLSRGTNGLGLELTLGAGVKGSYELLHSKENAHAYGADVLGKYVINDDTALVFGTEYVFWNIPHSSDNASEWRLQGGVQQNITDELTLSAVYQFRELKDMVQSNAHEATITLNYAYSEQIDVGMFAGASNFNAVKNGFTADSDHKQGIGMYMSYRF